MYVINLETKNTLFKFLDLIKPEFEEIEKLESLRKFEALRLHELPLFFALFVFDCAMRDMRLAIKLKDVALQKKHWFPLILSRIELIGTDQLKEIMQFIKPFEENSHKKKEVKESGI